MSSKTRLAQAYHDLSVMMDAGVPILRSFDIAIEGRRGYLKRVLSQIREAISKGSSLAEAVGDHRDVFRDMDLMLIDAAETSGSLSLAFKMLSQWYEFSHRIAQRMTMGLIYPVAVFHIAALVFGMPGLVLGSTTVAEYLRQTLNILLLLYIPATAIITAMALRDRVPALAYPLDFLVLRVPLLGRAVYHVSVSRYARAFAMMYGAGVPMTEVTERATQATGNMVVAGLFAGGIRNVRAGGLAWEGYSKRLLPQYLHLFQIGEETGELDRTASKIAEIAGDRADLMFTEFSKWFPRVVYAVVAGIMIYMIGQIFQSIYGNLPMEGF